LPAVVALLFFAFIFSYYPFREKLQFDSDEGLNLMRSMLVTLGHPLYSEVSSDQPPLFTQMLALLFRLTGFEVNPARFLVLLFAALVVWSGAQFLEITWGHLAAILFLPLAIMLPQYLRLSTSVMIGVPSVALAAVSMVFVVFWHKQHRDLWLALSGFALALSVLIKLFTGFLAPILLVGITMPAYMQRRGERLSWRVLQPAMLWSLCFGGLGLVLGLALVGPQNMWSIIYPHVAAPTTDWLQGGAYTLLVLRRRKLHIQADLLVPIAHWITPEVETRRFDTRFLAAALPAGQDVDAHVTETDSARWMAPGDALAEHRRGALAMLPPTVAVLTDLAGQRSVGDALNWARTREVVPLMPRAQVSGEDLTWVLVHAYTGEVLSVAEQPAGSEERGTR